MRGLFAQRVGDVDDPKDAELIRSASPLFAADRIKIPLLIGQGQNDPRVKPQEAEQIVAAVEKNGGRAIYVLYPDEGHGSARPENDTDFNARVERFLGAELGGRVEPLQGERIPGSTAVVRVIAPRKPGPGSPCKRFGVPTLAGWNPDLNLRLCGGAIIDLSHTRFPFSARIPIDRRSA